MIGDESAKELIGILNDLKKTMAESKERRHNAQEIHQHVNAGGHAVWVVVLMAAVIFTAAIMQQPRIADHERKIDRLEDYLSAIYQQVPGLKEQVEKNVNDHYNHPASDESRKK